MNDLYAPLDETWPDGFEAVMVGVPTKPTPPGSVAEFAKRICFGDLWQRPELSRRDKRLITFTVLCLQGSPRQQKDHIQAALRSGDLTESELNGFLLHLGFYSGFPRAVEVLAILRTVIEEEAAGAEAGPA